jgi:GT2 family glycosyltransferase
MVPNLFYGPALSVVIATTERLEHLKRCVAAVRCSTRAQTEIIVVGGGENDGASEWAAREYGVRFVSESRRCGVAAAYNLGLRAAGGRFVAWLHDDSRPHAGALDAAMRVLKRPDNGHIGCVALYHSGKRGGDRADTLDCGGRTFRVRQMAGVFVPSFGLMRREVITQVNFLDERYYAAAWDADLALQIHKNAKLHVVGCREALVEHDELFDNRKRTEAAMVQRDLERLSSKWELALDVLCPAVAPGELRIPGGAAQSVAAASV